MKKEKNLTHVFFPSLNMYAYIITISKKEEKEIFSYSTKKKRINERKMYTKRRNFYNLNPI